MTSTMSDRFGKGLAAALCGLTLSFGGLALLGETVPAAAAQTKEQEKDKPAGEGEPTKRDVIIFRTGNKVEGEILEETETTVKVRVYHGKLSAETVYQKADILVIERNSGAPIDGSKKEEKSDPSSKDAAKKDEKASESSGGPKVYVINMTGEFGRDVSNTPMRAVLQDVVKHEPDVLVCRFDHIFATYGMEKADFQPDLGSFDQLEHARQIDSLFDQYIYKNPDVKKKPRRVAWVKKAMGGAAFLPFVFEEIYYTSDAVHGGIGYLEALFEGVGDVVVREKQRSLRMGRAEGLAIKGGHDPIIMRAMGWTLFELSVRFDDGKPVLLQRMPESADEILLTDNGVGENADFAEDVIRMRGNDSLTLTADMAERIGFSRGTADTLDDLMYAMGVPRDYKVVEGKAKQILKNWSEEVGKAEVQFYRLWREYARVELKPPGGFKERTAYRTQHKNVLRQIQAILRKYQESINPYAIQGAPQGWTQQIDWMIEQIETQQRMDRPD